MAWRCFLVRNFLKCMMYNGYLHAHMVTVSSLQPLWYSSSSNSLKKVKGPSYSLLRRSTAHTFLVAQEHIPLYSFCLKQYHSMTISTTNHSGYENCVVVVKQKGLLQQSIPPPPACHTQLMSLAYLTALKVLYYVVIRYFISCPPFCISASLLSYLVLHHYIISHLWDHILYLCIAHRVESRQFLACEIWVLASALSYSARSHTQQCQGSK